MTTLCVANDHFKIADVNICSAPNKVCQKVFYGLIQFLYNNSEIIALADQASRLINESESALKKCQGEASLLPWHPERKIESYVVKVKKEYDAHQGNSDLRGKGPVVGEVPVAEGGPVTEDVPVGEDGPVTEMAPVKEEEDNKKILLLIGLDLYTGGGRKAVFIFRNAYEKCSSSKQKAWLKTIRAWQSELREACGKRLSELESSTQIEAWCDGDIRYQKLKREVDGTPSQSKDVTPQHDRAYDPEHLRPVKRQRQDPIDSQLDGEGVQLQSTNTQSSSDTQASLGSVVPQEEVMQVQIVDIDEDPKNGIHLPPRPPPDPSLRQSPQIQQPPSSGGTFKQSKVPTLAFLKKAGSDLVLPTGWTLSVEELCIILQARMKTATWKIRELPGGNVCVTAGGGVDLTLTRHSPMDLARCAKGSAATWADLLALSLTTKKLSDYISNRLGLSTDLNILYISGVPLAITPQGLEGVFLFTRQAFSITGTVIEERRKATDEKSQA